MSTNTSPGRTRFVATPHPWVDTPSGSVLIAPSPKGALALHPPTLWIWQELAVPRTLDELCDALTGAHDGPDAELKADISRHVHLLIELGLAHPT